LNKDAPVSRPVQRIGVISSHAFSADFTTTTPEQKFRYTQGRRRSLRSRGHASGSHRSAAGQHDQLADHRRPVDPATELEHTRLVGGERDGGELAALDGETDIVAVDRGRVLRALTPRISSVFLIKDSPPKPKPTAPTDKRRSIACRCPRASVPIWPAGDRRFVTSRFRPKSSHKCLKLSNFIE
jgi:hypothetical protein